MRNLFFILTICASLFGGVVSVNPESLEIALAEHDSDSSLSVRARLAYARGLYHSAKDLAERISEPSQSDILMLGQCCHILAQPHAARGYFSRITDPDISPLATLGLAELYCGDIADRDSCQKYIGLISGMDYLSRYVSLALPNGDASESAVEETDEHFGSWTLQFGAFEMESLARQMAVKVKQEGLRTWITPIISEGKTMFYIFGGEFATKGEAAAQADAMAREFECQVVEMPEE